MEIPILKGEKIYLRRMTVDDVTERYVGWLNDPEINQYLECRFSTHTIEETKDFVKSVTDDSNYQFGIYDIISNQHIGNVKVGSINSQHNYGDIGFLIGEKNYWGKGIATEAVKLATEFAFNTLKLHKLTGGLYEPNIGSKRTFQKNGYEEEGRLKNQYLLNGKYIDVLLFGKINEK